MKLRILHVIPSVGPLRGGPSFAVRTMTEALAARGVSVDIATTDDNGPDRLNVPHFRPVVENNVVYHYFPLDVFFYNTSFSLAMWLHESMASYHVVHIHALFSFCSTSAAILAQRKGIPYVVRPVGALNVWGMRKRRPWLKQLSFRLVEKRILAHAARVHYTSKQEKEEASLLGVRTEALIIPNQIALPPATRSASGVSLRGRYPELANRKIVLFLSRIDRKKGIELLLRAFVEVLSKEPEAALIIAGAGEAEYVMQLRNECSVLGVESAVYWPGFVAGPDKESALAEADVFALPSYSENFGIAAVEAMAHGLPVIISDQVGIHEDIARANAGIVTSCNPSSLAAAIVRLLSCSKERSVMGCNGLILARDMSSPAAAAARLDQLYSDIHCEHLRRRRTIHD